MADDPGLDPQREAGDKGVRLAMAVITVATPHHVAVMMTEIAAVDAVMIIASVALPDAEIGHQAQATVMATSFHMLIDGSSSIVLSHLAPFACLAELCSLEE